MLSVASTGGLTAYFLSGPPASTVVAPAAIVALPGPAGGSSGAAGTVAPGANSSVIDGAIYHNRWGDVQVRATFDTSGSLVAVDAVRTPDDRDRSVQINDHAVPQLNDEALAAQSARIHSVSGATYTSDDYRRSLQSAIDAARQATVTTLA